MTTAHYAFLDDNNRVVEVIAGRDEGDEGIDWEQYYSQIRGLRCVRTSYNARIRGKYAGIGDYYNEELDRFVSPTPVEQPQELSEEQY